MTYDGTYYKEIGNALAERYLEYGFTQGTLQEVDFLVDLLALPEGARILDIGCGPGRHSLELARRGYQVTGLDITPAFIRVATQQASAEGLAAAFICQDARDPYPFGDFEAAICLCEGAFGLAGGDEGHRSILRNVHAALRPGAAFVLSAFSGYGAARRAGADGTLDPESGVISERISVSLEDGTSREMQGFTTTFTPRELRALVEPAGFAVDAVWGCMPGAFAKRPLELDDYEFMFHMRRH